jgi:hypothetical protein
VCMPQCARFASAWAMTAIEQSQTTTFDSNLNL